MQVGTGKSVLNGIAIGKLKIYKKKDTAISTAPVADTAAELERFEAARQKAIEQQTALYEKALAEAGEDIAEVFNIHAMMLDDDDFVDAIKEIINGQHKCAETEKLCSSGISVERFCSMLLKFLIKNRQYERVKKERLRFIIKINIQQPEGSSAASRGAG